MRLPGRKSARTALFERLSLNNHPFSELLVILGDFQKVNPCPQVGNIQRVLIGKHIAY